MFQTGLQQSPVAEPFAKRGLRQFLSARSDRIANGNLDKGVRTIDRFYDVAHSP